MKIQRKDDFGEKIQAWVTRDGMSCEIVFVEKDISDEGIIKRAEALFSSIDLIAATTKNRVAADKLLEEKMELVKDIPIQTLKTKLGLADPKVIEDILP